MAQAKTYLLAPNFDFQPDGPIALGNIIADPFNPTYVLSSLDPAAPTPEVGTTTQLEHNISRSHGLSAHAGVWAQFLQTASVDVRGQISKDVTTRYTTSALETRYFKAYPTDKDAAERVKAPKVQAAIKAGLFGDQPVYMVTGVKIAKDFALESGVQRSVGGEVGGGAPVPAAGDFSVGAEVGGERRRAEEQSFRTMHDIVFAFQLHVISHKGWRQKRAVAQVYKSKAAFLNDDVVKAVDAAPMEATPATKDDLMQVEVGDMSVETVEVGEGEEKCVCISFKEIEE